MKLLLKHDASNATTIAEPLLAADMPYVEETFDGVTEITITHPYNRIVRVDIVDPKYYRFPETRIASVQYLDGSVRVVFHVRESGTVHISP